MSISIRYHAVIPVDGDLYQKHKRVRDACAEAGVTEPVETVAFFDDDDERETTNEGVFVSVGSR